MPYPGEHGPFQCSERRLARVSGRWSGHRRHPHDDTGRQFERRQLRTGRVRHGAIVRDNRYVGIAYGLELSGWELGADLLERGSEEFPSVAVQQRQGPMPSGAQQLDELGAKLSLLDGERWVTLDRASGRATFWGPPLNPDELVHPWLWPVASVFARWYGREAFHGGALIQADSAWAVLGPKESGKSTLLAAHAARGGAVLSDDLVVTDGSLAFTGPRCIDLRQPLPPPLDTRLAFTPARDHTRRRVALAPLPASVPLAGWVFVSWGPSLAINRLSATEALGRLARWRAWTQLESDSAVMLKLASIPAFELRRPRSWDSLEPGLDLMLNASP